MSVKFGSRVSFPVWRVPVYNTSPLLVPQQSAHLHGAPCPVSCVGASPQCGRSAFPVCVHWRPLLSYRLVARRSWFGVALPAAPSMRRRVLSDVAEENMYP